MWVKLGKSYVDLSYAVKVYISPECDYAIVYGERCAQNVSKSDDLVEIHRVNDQATVKQLQQVMDVLSAPFEN